MRPSVFPDEGGWTCATFAQTYTYCQSKTGPWAATRYGDWSTEALIGDIVVEEQSVPEIIGSDSGAFFY